LVYEGKVEIPFTGLTLHIFVALSLSLSLSPSQNIDFQHHMMSWFFFMFKKLRLEVIDYFVDIGEIADHNKINDPVT